MWSTKLELYVASNILAAFKFEKTELTYRPENDTVPSVIE